MAEIKGGITVTGNSVDTMPVILDGRQSLYEEAIEKGTIPRDTTYEKFLELLAVKPSEISQAVKDAVDKQLDKAVKVAVDANLETAVNNAVDTAVDTAVGKAVAAAVSAAIAKIEANRASNPAPMQPATGDTGANTAATPTPAPTQPATGGTGNNAAATDNSGVSDEALADILKDLGS